jgi:hypothetical protein
MHKECIAKMRWHLRWKNNKLTNYDWIDEVLDGKPTEITYMQLATIDNLLPYTTLTTSMQEEIRDKLNDLTELEAEQIIKELKQNEITIDPKRQYEQMRKAGVFKS